MPENNQIHTIVSYLIWWKPITTFLNVLHVESVPTTVWCNSSVSLKWPGNSIARSIFWIMNKSIKINKALEHKMPSFKLHILLTLVMQQRMLHELVFATEEFLTNLTMVWLLFCVNQEMPVKMILISKHFVANVTLMLFYQAVLWRMLDTSTTVTRGLAQLTIWSCFPRMHRQMSR
jgi:hypothetical protein